MATSYIRRKNTTVAIGLETTQAVDVFAPGGGPAASADFLKADVTLAYNQQLIANPELTGTLDASPSIAGGTKVSLTITTMLKGSGAANVAPQWGKLLEISGWAKTAVAAVAASAATAGTTSTATLGAGYTDTAQLYRGMPAVLTGNPVGPLLTTIADYAGGKVATLAHTFLTPLSATTQVAIPAHTLYRPSSDPAATKTATIYVFTDGLVWRLVGCAATWKADINAGGVGTLTTTVTGMYQAPVAGNAPVGLVFDAPQPPVFRGGMARLGGALARISKATFDASGTLFEPENPEADEGFDSSVITGRAPKANFDPLMTVSDTIARVAQFKQGAPTTAAVAYGTTAGNRLAFTIPRAQYTAYSPTNRSELMADNLPIECNAPDASIIVAVA